MSGTLRKGILYIKCSIEREREREREAGQIINSKAKLFIILSTSIFRRSAVYRREGEREREVPKKGGEKLLRLLANTNLYVFWLCLNILHSPFIRSYKHEKQLQLENSFSVSLCLSHLKPCNKSSMICVQFKGTEILVSTTRCLPYCFCFALT